jgi:hypothetical protein
MGTSQSDKKAISRDAHRQDSCAKVGHWQVRKSLHANSEISLGFYLMSMSTTVCYSRSEMNTFSTPVPLFELQIREPKCGDLGAPSPP